MHLQLKFEEDDFANLRAFEKAVKKQLGTNVYVNSDSLCFYFEYPKALKLMLRPFPETKQFEFDLDSSLPDEKRK